MPDLRKEVLRRRARRSWFVVALAIAVPAQLAALRLLCAPRTEVRIVERHTADVIAVPMPLPVETVVRIPQARAACPPPRTDAPIVKPARLPEAVTAIRPSPTNAGWIAAWNDAHIYLSTDAGVTWRRRLDGTRPVQDVGFDCFGRAIAMRGNAIGVRDGDAETWHAITGLRGEGATAGVVLGGGPEIVVIGRGGDADASDVRLLVSRDLGATWETRHLDTYWEGTAVRGRQYADGSVHAMITVVDCMFEKPFAFRYHDGAVTAIATADLRTSLAFFGDRMVASNGWLRIGSDTQHALPAPAAEDALVIEGAAYPIIVVENTPYRLDGRRARRLPWKLDGTEVWPVADPAGRIWSVRCGQPHVSSRAQPAACAEAPPQGAGDSR